MIISSIISIAAIGITTLLFIKYILYDDIVERNLDKIIGFFTGKKVKP